METFHRATKIIAAFSGGRMIAYDPSEADLPATSAPVASTAVRVPGRQLGSTNLTAVQPEPPPECLVGTPAAIGDDPVGEIAELLARAAKTTTGLSEQDRRRARDLFSAAYSLLRATTSLPNNDQELLSNALRGRDR